MNNEKKLVNNAKNIRLALREVELKFDAVLVAIKMHSANDDVDRWLTVAREDKDTALTAARNAYTPNIMDLKGTCGIRDDYDYKAERIKNSPELPPITESNRG